MCSYFIFFQCRRNSSSCCFLYLPRCWWGGTWESHCEKVHQLLGHWSCTWALMIFGHFHSCHKLVSCQGLVGKYVLFQISQSGWFFLSLLKFWTLINLLSSPKTKISLLTIFSKFRNTTFFFIFKFKNIFFIILSIMPNELSYMPEAG